MRLRSLTINRLPGIRPGFTLTDFAPGINVIIGPNASGKSSVMRALGAVLYDDELHSTGLDIEATFENAAGESLRAVRSGDRLEWSRGGQRLESPPLLPDHRFLSCYTLHVEDLLGAGATDDDIATRIARELAGGYDLPAIRDAEPFMLKTTHARTEANALATAIREYHHAQQARQALQEDEAELATLRRRRREADAAARDAEACEQALALLEVQRRRAGLEQRLAEFPDGMAQLHGDELETLTGLQAQRSGLDSERAQAQYSRTNHEETLAATGLDGVTIDDAEIADRRAELQRLQRLEGEAAQQRKGLTTAIAHRDEAARALGGAPGQLPQLDPDTIRAVEHRLDELRRINAVIARLESGIREAQRDEDADEGADIDKLREARRELLYWLAAPRASRPGRSTTIALLVTALVAVTAITVATMVLHPTLALLAVPLAWALYLLRPRGDGGDGARDAARERYRRTGVAPPDDWSAEDSVHARLDALDEALRHATERRQHAARRAHLERERAEQQALQAPLLEALRETAERVGFDPCSIDASLVRWLQLVAEFDRARTRVAEIDSERDRLEAEAGTLRADLVAFLARHDEAPESSSPDAAVLAQRLEHLADRLRRRDEARRLIAGTDRELHRLDEAIADHEQRIAEIYLRAGLADRDEAALRRKLEQRSAWQRLQRDLNDARTLEAERGRPLAGHADLSALVADGDESGLQARLDAARAEADQRESLIETIIRIENAIDRAGRDRALETALARRNQAGDALRERRDEALFAEAGRFLLDEVAAEHVRVRQPPELRRATEWFARFTRHQYTLAFDRETGVRFSAFETATGEYRRLSELSSGTRMQLLLAVRIAFAVETAEHGRETLPLLLDEALTTTDPERFTAIADSLRMLAADEGRQIFYLTAQPGDLAFWRDVDPEVHSIDLGALRGRQQALTDAARLAVPERPPVPDPTGLEAADYALRLGVPALDPWMPAEAIPAFHLLRDDLETVRRLREFGIERLGTLRALLDTGIVDPVLGERECRRLRARCAGAEAWLEAWRTGRGRPVDRHALEASGAVSTKFLDTVAARCDELGGDGEALIASLEAGDVSRFHNTKREELAAWLASHGHIDEREPLNAAEIDLRVIHAMQAALADDDDAVGEGRALVDSLDAARASAS